MEKYLTEAFVAALSDFSGTILAIAHGQYFIDRFAQIIWHFSTSVVQEELTDDLVL